MYSLAPWVDQVLELLVPERELKLVNVNLPRVPRGLCWARQSVRHYDGRVVPDEDPLGRRVYWISVRAIEHVEEGTDRWRRQRPRHKSKPPFRNSCNHRHLCGSGVLHRP